MNAATIAHFARNASFPNANAHAKRMKRMRMSWNSRRKRVSRLAPKEPILACVKRY